LNPLKAGDISTISRKSPSFFVFFVVKIISVSGRADASVAFLMVVGQIEAFIDRIIQKQSMEEKGFQVEYVT